MQICSTTLANLKTFINVIFFLLFKRKILMKILFIKLNRLTFLKDLNEVLHKTCLIGQLFYFHNQSETFSHQIGAAE